MVQASTGNGAGTAFWDSEVNGGRFVRTTRIVIHGD